MDSNRVLDRETRCARCGEHAYYHVRLLPLADEPIVCLRCVGEVLTGTRQAWSPFVLQEIDRAQRPRRPWWRRGREDAVV